MSKDIWVGLIKRKIYFSSSSHNVKSSSFIFLGMKQKQKKPGFLGTGTQRGSCFFSFQGEVWVPAAFPARDSGTSHFFMFTTMPCVWGNCTHTKEIPRKRLTRERKCIPFTTGLICGSIITINRAPLKFLLNSPGLPLCLRSRSSPRLHWLLIFMLSKWLCHQYPGLSRSPLYHTEITARTHCLCLWSGHSPGVS